MKKVVSILALLCFVFTGVTGPLPVYAGKGFILPTPGQMVLPSPAYTPLTLKGLKIYPENPFRFDFILDKGDENLSPPNVPIGGPDTQELGSRLKHSGTTNEQIKSESTRLIKYFLACLAIPEDDLWVNLSPYEKDHMIPQTLGQTELGRDMLAQDYVLKQLTASLIYPEKELGKEFWRKVYQKARALYGTTRVPVNTFNKVWVLADEARVFENSQGAFVTASYLKVMLEEDYEAFRRNAESRGLGDNSNGRGTTEKDLRKSLVPAGKSQGTRDGFNSSISTQIIREIVLPAIETEVNTGEHFAALRQMYTAFILAAWYKKSLKQALLNRVYADKGKVGGIGYRDKGLGVRAKGGKLIPYPISLSPSDIYNQYLQAYKKGVFNYIKEDIGPDGQTVPRKYFSGGTRFSFDHARLVRDPAQLTTADRVAIARANIAVTVDMAMSGGTATGTDLPEGLSRLLQQGAWIETRGGIPTESQGMAEDLMSGLHAPLGEFLKNYQRPAEGRHKAVVYSSVEIQSIARNLVNNVVRLGLRGGRDQLEALGIGSIEASSPTEETIMDVLKKVVKSLPEQVRADAGQMKQLLTIKTALIQRLILFREVYGYLKGYANISEEELAFLEGDLFTSAFYISRGIKTVKNAVENIREFKQIIGPIDRQSKEIKQQWLIAVYEVAMAGQRAAGVIEQYKETGIAWQEGWKDELKVQYLIAVYKVAMNGQSAAGVIEQYKEAGIAWKDIWKDELKVQYLIAVYNVAMKGQRADGVIEQYKEAGIAWQDSWSDELKVQYLIAVYKVAMAGQSAASVIKEYEQAGIAWQDSWKDELKVQYLIAVYAVAMKGQRADGVIEQYKEAGIVWQEGWKDELKVQYLIAVYNVAMKGQSATGVIEDYKQAGIAWQDSWKDELKVQYLIAVYAVAMAGQRADGVIEDYKQAGIAWQEGWSDELKVQYLIAVYAVAMKGQSAAGVIEDYKQAGIAWQEGWSDELKVQYLIAVYEVAMAGKGNKVKEILSLLSEGQKLDKMDQLRLSWRMASLDYSKQQVQTLIEGPSSMKDKLTELDKLVYGRVRAQQANAAVTADMAMVNPNVAMTARPSADKAMKAVVPLEIKHPGGIAFKARDLKMTVERQGGSVSGNIDPVMLQQLESGHFIGIVPVIIKVTPIHGAKEFLAVKEILRGRNNY